MNQTNVVALSKTKKLILGSATVLVVAVPVILGTSSSSVAVAQIDSTVAAYRPRQITKLERNTSGASMSRTTYTPEGTSISNTTVRSLIEMAYSLKSYQLTGGPGWIDQDRFDITYTGGEPVGSHIPVSNAAVREILSQRFHLVLHQDTKKRSCSRPRCRRWWYQVPLCNSAKGARHRRAFVQHACSGN